jgi:hypothetical protein
MIIGYSRASGFDPFDAISAFTPGAASSTSTATSNTLTFADGDYLVVVSAASRDATENAVTGVAGNWVSPPTFTQLAGDTFKAAAAARSSSLYVHGATSTSGETTEDVTSTWAGTIFNGYSAFFRIARGASLVQASPVAQKDESGTTLTATLGAASAATSVVILAGHQREDNAITLPGDFTDLLTGYTPATNSGLILAYKIGAVTTAQVTGLNASAVAQLVLVEFTRP